MEIILAIVAYLFIGGFIGGFFEDYDLDGFCRFLWPVIIVLTIIFYIGEAGEWLADTLRDTWQNIIDIKEEEE